MYCEKTLLGTISNGNVLTFEKLLEKNNSVTTHARNLRILAAELYKTKENLAAPIMHKIFEHRNIKYNLRSQTDCSSVRVSKNSQLWFKGTEISWS